MRLAAWLRREHPAVADELTSAAGYGPDDSEDEPSGVLPPGLDGDIRRAIPDPDDAAWFTSVVEAAVKGEPLPPRKRRAAR